MTKFWLYSLFLTTIAMAAPFPGAGSKSLIEVNKIFRSPWGFQIDARSSNWIQVSPDLESSPYLLTHFAPLSNDSRAKMSVRIDNLKNFPSKKPTIRKYVRYWTKQFPKFGFELLKTPQVFTKQNFAVVDSFDNDNNIQLRQYIFWKNKKAVILGCSDQIKSFQNNWKECDKLVRNFTWNK